MNLQGKVALVTGAGGRLGRAVTNKLLAEGAALVLVDQDVSELSKMSVPPDRCEVLQADLLRREAVDAAVARGIARFGRIDILCHLVGTFRMGAHVHETPAHEFALLLDVNVNALLNVANALVPELIRQGGGGHIVTVGALAADRGTAGRGAYIATKSALARLTESMSDELKDHHIHVNCVLPSLIDTPENRAAMPDADASRWVAPDALADVIALLCSPAARAIHGAGLQIAGRV